MLLVLRKLAFDHGDKPIHVIAENQQDQTSALALGPPLGSGNFKADHLPDFINTQAIIARSLGLNMAYPQIYEAVSPLLKHTPNEPNVGLVRPARLGLVGLEVSLGAVQHRILEDHKGTAAAIGYSLESNLVFAPDPRTKILWTDEYRIVVITREPVSGGPANPVSGGALVRRQSSAAAPHAEEAHTPLRRLPGCMRTQGRPKEARRQSMAQVDTPATSTPANTPGASVANGGTAGGVSGRAGLGPLPPIRGSPRARISSASEL
mmetsp:Transcript_28720/g.64175  ORF Transcript_28720/g.64175 Transcript_28720/m.64175 type:complete len:264 (-) Transcript_28720:228-1019(-)